MGYLRFILCLAVIADNIGNLMICGKYAVFGFFVLSGFLTALVTTEIYGTGWKGKAYYLQNRFVRLYPTYLLALLLSFALIALFPGISRFHTGIYFPHTVLGWIKQFTIVGLSGFDGRYSRVRLVPTAWSLSTEIVYFFIIGVLLGGHRRATTIAFLMVSVLTVVAIFQNMRFSIMFISIHGAAIAFFTGAVAYYWRHELQPWLARNTLIPLLVASIVVFVPDTLIKVDIRNTVLFYCATLIFAWVIVSLHMISLKEKTSIIERWFADLTYPVFLLQWQVAWLFAYYFGMHKSMKLGIITAFAATALAALVLKYIEYPLKRKRAAIRHKALAARPLAAKKHLPDKGSI